MSYRVIIEETAEQDLKEAAQWIAQPSPEKALLWYFDISDAIASLAQFPLLLPCAGE